MTSKLTRERIEWLNYAATGLAANGTEMAMSPQDVIALTEYCLAGMDSEPNRNPVLAYADSYRDMAKQGVESVQIWSVITDLERNIAPLYRHAQPVVPATLPCSVELKPGLIIGKGCKTETLLTALRRRADHNADIDAMTPEERAEYDANIEAFKAMLPQPAPVVPDGLIGAVNRLLDSDGSRGCYSATQCGDAHDEIERLLAAAQKEVKS